MANNDRDNPRRDPNRPEDNPFIAFRRFADSQVSSLLNSVFTLPATIANYNNAHQAREQCLFGKADKRQCDKLHEIESQITDLRHEGRELFRMGDVQAVLRNSEQLMRLDRRADELRRDIVDQAASNNRGNVDEQSERSLVERVGNEKGQEWGWSWDWGFPRPFDHDGNSSRSAIEDEAAQQAREIELMLKLQSEVKKMVGESTFDDAMAVVKEVFDNDDTHPKHNEKLWNGGAARVQRHPTESDSREPRVWSWSGSWQWPPPADSSQPDDSAYSPRVLEKDPEMKLAGVQWREAYEDLLRAERNDRPHCMRSDDPVPSRHGCRRGLFRNRDGERSRDLFPYNEAKWAPQENMEANDEPSYEYGHDHEDQHDDPPTPKVDQGNPFPAFRTAEEDDERPTQEDQQIEKLLEQQEERKRQFPDSSEQSARDQHKTYQSKQQETATELDAYEQLLGAKEQSLYSSSPLDSGTTHPSILSTLTTTERTVSPDGVITTKVVLKKRFADGREESSETIQTQRGHADNTRPQELRKATQEPQVPSPEKESKKDSGKRSGWFWSS
ncbi:Nn.00g083470.m01.CDS01 [Neocucurbitaria sp. VM-36]